MAGPVSALIQLVSDLGWDDTPESGAAVFQGPFVPRMPHRLLVLTPVPGPGYVWEGAGDAGAFQARVRGLMNDQADAEKLAIAFDHMIYGAQFPAVVNGTVIVNIHRFSGDPSPLLPGPDDGNRYEYTCSYVWLTGV